MSYLDSLDSRDKKNEASTPVDDDVGPKGLRRRLVPNFPRPKDWRKLKLGEPKRIGLMVEPTPFTHVSGYSNRFNEMLRYLNEAGDTVQIVTPDETKGAPSSAHGFPITNLPGFKFAMYPVTLALDLSGRSLKAMRRFRPDLLHVSSPGFLCFAGILVSQILNVPLVLSYHTHLPVYARNYGNTSSFFRLAGPAFCEELSWKCLRLVHSLADLTLVTSPQIQAELESHGIERVKVWRKGIDTVRFDPKFKSDAMRATLSGGALDAALLIYVGRLAMEKRLLDLVPVLQAHPSARLALVGTGPAEKELKKAFEGTNTVFTGQLRGDELSAAFASADVFVMPSDSETLGFVVLEAMASGVPVVGAEAGGIPSIIDHGTNGLLARPADTHDLSAKVGDLLNDPGARRAMAVEARAEAEQWDWKTATAHLRNVQYRQAAVNFQRRRTIPVLVGGYFVNRFTALCDWFADSFVSCQPATHV